VTYQEDAGVMVDVQEAQLLPTLLRNDEKGISEIQNLGKVEDIQNKSDRRILNVELIARQNGVASVVSTNTSFDAHIRAEHDLDHVVQELERVQARNSRQAGHDQLWKGR
jgi:ATP-dependent helicase/DNAse subunit B